MYSIDVLIGRIKSMSDLTFKNNHFLTYKYRDTVSKVKSLLAKYERYKTLDFVSKQMLESDLRREAQDLFLEIQDIQDNIAQDDAQKQLSVLEYGKLNHAKRNYRATPYTTSRAPRPAMRNASVGMIESSMAGITLDPSWIERMDGLTFEGSSVQKGSGHRRSRRSLRTRRYRRYRSRR
jgi:hypothetical protein